MMSAPSIFAPFCVRTFSKTRSFSSVFQYWYAQPKASGALKTSPVAGSCPRTFRAGQQGHAAFDGRRRRLQCHAGGFGIEEHRQVPGLLGEDLVEHSQQPIVFAGAQFGLPLRQAMVFQRPAAVRRLLQDHLVDQFAGFHAPQGEQAVGPGVGRLANELRHGVFARHAGLGAEFQIGIHDLPGLLVGRCQCANSSTFTGSRSRRTPIAASRCSRSPGATGRASYWPSSKCRSSRLIDFRIFLCWAPSIVVERNSFRSVFCFLVESSLRVSVGRR